MYASVNSENVPSVPEFPPSSPTRLLRNANDLVEMPLLGIGLFSETATHQHRRRSYLELPTALPSARVQEGGEFHTSGQILVAAAEIRNHFSETRDTVLQQRGSHPLASARPIVCAQKCPNSRTKRCNKWPKEPDHFCFSETSVHTLGWKSNLASIPGVHQRRCRDRVDPPLLTPLA